MSAVAPVAGACAGALAGAGVASLMLAAADGVAARASRVAMRSVSWVDAAVAPLRLAGSAGLLPTDRERLRLGFVLAATGLLAGVMLAGPLAGIAVSLVAGASTSRLLLARRERYGRRIDAGAGRAALALADALSGGHSVRGALVAAVSRLDGPIRVEFDRVVSDIAVGLTTDDALHRLRERSRSRRVDMVVAALRLQRRSGGELARLLRDIAAAAEASARLQGEARAATAQARFTALLVTGFGPCAVALAELAAPGTIARVTGSASGLTLLAVAAVMQGAGAFAVSRISRVVV